MSYYDVCPIKVEWRAHRPNTIAKIKARTVEMRPETYLGCIPEEICEYSSNSGSCVPKREQATQNITNPVCYSRTGKDRFIDDLTNGITSINVPAEPSYPDTIIEGWMEMEAIDSNMQQSNTIANGDCMALLNDPMMASSNWYKGVDNSFYGGEGREIVRIEKELTRNNLLSNECYVPDCVDSIQRSLNTQVTDDLDAMFGKPNPCLGRDAYVTAMDFNCFEGDGVDIEPVNVNQGGQIEVDFSFDQPVMDITSKSQPRQRTGAPEADVQALLALTKEDTVEGGGVVTREIITKGVNDLLGMLITSGGITSFFMSNMTRVRIFQKLMPYLRRETVLGISETIAPKARDLIRGKVGGFSLLTFVERYTNHCHAIYNTVLADLVDISCHKRGCCSIQKFVDLLPEDVRIVYVDKFISEAKTLCSHPYGNYTVQHLMTKRYGNDTATRLFHQLSDDIDVVISNKYSSCVIEKILVHGYKDVRMTMAGYFSKAKISGIRKYISNPYANYVFQRSLDLACDENHIYVMLQGVRAALQSIRKLSGGRVLAAKLCQKYPIIACCSNGRELKLYCSNLSKLRSAASRMELVGGVFLTE